MEGRWEGAPVGLIRNLERFERYVPLHRSSYCGDIILVYRGSADNSDRTLASIHTFMTAEAEQKWHARLLRKNTIEEAITRFHAELDDATRMFQV